MDVGTIDGSGPSGWSKKGGQTPKGGGLPGPVRAQESIDLPGMDLQREVREGFERAKVFGEALKDYHSNAIWVE
jgi:hypothetical protein